MLPATPEETQAVIDYMNWQAPDLTVEFLQKVYAENVLSHQHQVWDVHTNVDRWWVITNPTNLYSQEQFPNMDLAVTFHVGLCLRIPRSQKAQLSDLPIEPFAECYRYMTEASDALDHAQEVADYQAIGVRCREAMLDSAWKFSNWLTHAKASMWHDAEAATSTVEHAISLGSSAVIRHMRGVPETCPACGSHRLSPQRGVNSEHPDIEWERPTCDKCGWAGAPVPVFATADSYNSEGNGSPPPGGKCVVPSVPLRILRKPGGGQV